MLLPHFLGRMYRLNIAAYSAARFCGDLPLLGLRRPFFVLAAYAARFLLGSDLPVKTTRPAFLRCAYSAHLQFQRFRA